MEHELILPSQMPMPVVELDISIDPEMRELDDEPILLH